MIVQEGTKKMEAEAWELLPRIHIDDEGGVVFSAKIVVNTREEFERRATKEEGICQLWRAKVL